MANWNPLYSQGRGHRNVWFAMPVTRIRHLSQSTACDNSHDPLPDWRRIPWLRVKQNHTVADDNGASDAELPSATTPTEYLIRALQETGHTLGKGHRSRHKFDLSFVNPDNHASLTTLRRHRRPKQTSRKPSRLALQTILADYLRLVDPFVSQVSDTDTTNPLDKVPKEALENVPTARYTEYLATRGYDDADVVAWAWILKSQDTHRAALRLFTLEAHYRAEFRDAAPAVPPFIPLFLLKEGRLDAHTFRLLLIYSLHLMSGQPLPAGNIPSMDAEISTASLPEHFHRTIDPTMCMTFVVRLIRHARQVWPSALPIIANAFARFLGAPSSKSSVLAAQETESFRTSKFNACLWLLSLPTKIRPFHSVSIQQQAQFEILRAMAAHKPVLPVTRKGYQGIIAVQLAHKKTSEERQSAQLKAPSWPPWKEEKLGIDSQRGNEGRISRAMQVMSQMNEAGYPHARWEEIATVLAGWDTDHSPTVQTRSMMHRPGSNHDQEDHDQSPLWVARIRATRTVREAWACFLSYQDHGLPPKGNIYAAMAEKVIYGKKAIESGFDHTQVLPGDSREVHPEPASARDIIYVHTEPPTLGEFLDEMLSHGFRFSGMFLALLLESAPTFYLGLHYLRNSDLKEDEIAALTTVWSQPSGYETQDLEPLHRLPEHLFASFIGFLCRHATFEFQHIFTADVFPILMASNRRLHTTATLLSSQPELHQSRALWHAVQLSKLRHPPSSQAWTHILTALAYERVRRPHWKMSREAQRILVWYEILETSKWMKEYATEPGVKGFHSICVAFAKAMATGIRNPDAAEEAFILMRRNPRFGVIPHTEDCDALDILVLQEGLRALKDQFDYLVLPSQTSKVAERSIFTEGSAGAPLTIPTILHTPLPSALHAFVRALGTAEDYEGLLNLLRWMSRSAAPLEEAAGESLNGARLLRRTLVAMRVFLERGPGMHEAEAYNIVSRIPGWTWPSDAEVSEYRSFVR